MFTKPTPLWITVGGFSLASVAGAVNAVGFLGVHRQALTHLSGTVTTVAIDTVAANWETAGHAAMIFIFFFLGCVLSGLIIRRSTLRLGRRYGVALVCESLLLLTATLLFRHRAAAGDYIATMACGLQNAMVSSYSGAVVRTTHMTGIVTDLGIAAGVALRGEVVDWRRVCLYLILLAGFLAGGFAGGWAYLRLGYDALLAPALLTGLVGAGYALYKHFNRETASA